MEFLLLMPFLAMLMAMLVTGYNALGAPYLNGTKQIDKYRYPTLARAQRILRASNTKKRELEAKARLKELTAKQNDVTIEAGNKRLTALQAVRERNAAEHDQWTSALALITKEEDDRKRAEAAAIEAEKRAERLALQEEVRKRELEIWTANEKVRLKQFIADQKALQAEEDRKAMELLRSRENELHSLSKHHVGGQYVEANQHMLVNVHGLYVRKLPTKDSRIVDNLATNSWCTVNGWITYEELYGNPIWFRLANGQGWIWSGGVHSQATTGLENLNHWKQEGDSFIQKDASGRVVMRHTGPSRLQSLINEEIDFLKKDKDRLALEMRGSNPWEMKSIPPRTESITRNGQTVTIFGGLASPSETQHLLPLPSERRSKSDFWRGTQFENM